MRLLIVEDEMDLNDIIRMKMENEGYNVDSCYDGQEALLYLESVEYDAVIMDVMIPKINGFDVVKNYREKGGQSPIIFLTARDEICDRVKGLDTGGNDYLVKPFSFDELMARIRAMTRKAAGNNDNIYMIADLVLDSKSKKVTRAGKNINLSAKEYSLLEYMIRNKDKVLSRERIEDNLYNFDYEGGTNVIDVYIRYLRKKIDDGFDKKLIHTVRGSGYVLREE